jgi:hypothetical protein
MISLRERRDIAYRKVIHCKSEICGALPEGLAVEVPVDGLVVEPPSVHHGEDTRKRDIIPGHDLNRSDDEQGVCQW